MGNPTLTGKELAALVAEEIGRHVDKIAPNRAERERRLQITKSLSEFALYFMTGPGKQLIHPPRVARASPLTVEAVLRQASLNRLTRDDGSKYWIREHSDFFGYFEPGTSYKAGDRVWWDERGWIACSDTEAPPGPDSVWRAALSFYGKPMGRRFVAYERVFKVDEKGLEVWLCLKGTTSAPVYGDSWQLLTKKEKS